MASGNDVLRTVGTWVTIGGMLVGGAFGAGQMMESSSGDIQSMRARQERLAADVADLEDRVAALKDRVQRLQWQTQEQEDAQR